MVARGCGGCGSVYHALVTDLPYDHPLLEAYARGAFPMGVPGTSRVRWFSPDPRTILPLDAFHIPRSLGQRVRSGRFLVTSDQAFGEVMRACARPRENEPETWITPVIRRAYAELHTLGHAHSVEAWLVGQGGERALVGGLYGVSLGGFFAGESMFSRPELGGTDASKVCLVHLVGHLRRRGFTLLDVQFQTPHLERFGCIEVAREEYLALLGAALVVPASWGAFEPGGV